MHATPASLTLWQTVDRMRCLVVSPDARFVAALRLRRPHAVEMVDVRGAAGALCLLQHGAVDYTVLDAVPDPEAASEFLTWWRADRERLCLPLIVAGGRHDRLPANAHAVPRHVEAVVAALEPGPIQWLNPDRRSLQGPTGAIHLTPTETALLAYLVHAAEPVPAVDLLHDALGYADDASIATVRTHVGNLRRKCRQANVPQVVRTLPRTGYYAEGVALRREPGPQTTGR